MAGPGFGETTLLQSALEQTAARGLRGRCITPGLGHVGNESGHHRDDHEELAEHQQQREQGHHRNNGSSGAARGPRPLWQGLVADRDQAYPDVEATQASGVKVLAEHGEVGSGVRSDHVDQHPVARGGDADH